MRVTVVAVLAAIVLGCRSPEPVTDLPRVPALGAPSTLEQEPVPRTLEEALATLERAAPGRFLADIRRDDESVPVAYHHGLGMWIRNHWGLWQRGPLYQDLARYGFRHPDEMSAAILDTFWRRQHGRPPDLESLVRKEKEWAEEWKQREAAFQARRQAEQARVRSMVMGLTLVPSGGPALRLHPRESDGLRARYLAPHASGALIGVRTVPDRQGAFRIEPYQFDLSTLRISPARVRELDEVSSLMKIADTIWVTGRAGTSPTLVALDEARRTVPLPRNAVPQLGADDAGALLAVYTDAVYRLTARGWTTVRGGLRLRPSGPPPRLVRSRLYIRDEGFGENDKQLWYIDLASEAAPVPLQRDAGMTLNDVTSYAFGPDGTAWFAGGNISGVFSLLARDANGRFALATVYGDVVYRDPLPETPSVRLSAVTVTPTGRVLAAGSTGFYAVEQGRIRTLTRFADTAQLTDDNLYWDWIPTDILEIGRDRYLIAGLFGGIYLLDLQGGGIPRLTELDEHLGPPVAF